MKKTIFRVISFVVVLLFALSCGGGGGGGGGQAALDPPNIDELETYSFATSGGKVVHFSKGKSVQVYIGSGDGVDAWLPSMNGTVSSMVTRWNGVGEKWGLFSVSTTEDSARAEVIITWVTSLGGNLAGKTTYTSTDSRLNLPVVIEIPTHISGKLMSPSQVGLAAVHEMGHALGLWQHSPVKSDVMFSAAGVGTPSQRDRNTIYKLYNTTPHVTSSVKAPSALGGEEVTYSVACPGDVVFPAPTPQ